MKLEKDNPHFLQLVSFEGRKPGKVDVIRYSCGSILVGCIEYRRMASQVLRWIPRSIKVAEEDVCSVKDCVSLAESDESHLWHVSDDKVNISMVHPNLGPLEAPQNRKLQEWNDLRSAVDASEQIQRGTTLQMTFPEFDIENDKTSADKGLRSVQHNASGATTHSRTSAGGDPVDHNSGVWLTWKDLWVTVSTAKRGKTQALLQGLTGYAQPGKFMAIMGPSGSGKSTLLDALAGRLASNAKQSGNILVNGRRQTLSFGTSAYVTQEDNLMETLTVGEAVFYSAQLQLPDSMTNAEKRERAEMTIKEMGLQHSVNTIIGGWRRKSLSGGEKRRVSICIEILTRPKLLFLDEPTSGLDSSCAYHVAKRLSSLAREDGRTVIVCIHQPSTEVFELFHSLYLLCAGRTVFFGEASWANQFFAVNGFPCPPLRNPSDHYLCTINSGFERDIEEGDDLDTAEVIDLLVKSYQSSDIAKTVLCRVDAICKREMTPLEVKGSQAGFLMQTCVLTRRSFVNMHRDLGYYWLRLGIYVTLALCTGTIFHNVGQKYGAIRTRSSVLAFVSSFMTFMAIGGFPSFVEDLKVFGRERLSGHYGVAAFVIGNTISSIPYVMLMSVIPGSIAYLLVKLHTGMDHIVYFVLLLFACLMLVESLMMTVATVVPDFLMGIIAGAGIQGVMMLNGGFFCLPNDLPKPFWKYPIYYIAFHKYATQGLYKNDFQGLKFSSNQAGVPPVNADDILRHVWNLEMGYSKWIDLLILSGMVIAYRLMFFLMIKLKEKARWGMLSKPVSACSRSLRPCQT